MGAGLLDPEFLIGASLADDRFKIVARVGAGSMAIVYRAFDHRLETEVVIKVPKKHKLQDAGLANASVVKADFWFNCSTRISSVFWMSVCTATYRLS
ncbi:MAG: hypothetical protein WKF77_18200 [Planctomycetaceae bacterium]